MYRNLKFAVFSVALALLLACSTTFVAAQTSSAPGSTAQSPSATPPPASSQAQTQGAGPSQSQVDETIAWLTESVNLTPDQQTKLRPILQGEVSQMTAVNNDATLTPEQKQQKMVDIRRSAGPQIQSILTPEQQQKLTQMRQSQQQGGAPPQQQGGAPPQR
jgi:Spy/CpxP family protein refolding chaperone